MSVSNIAVQRSHKHSFGEGNPLAEQSTKRAVILTAIMMVVEIVGGWVLNSMALLADGWHMSSHALALGLALFAYAFARKHAQNDRFTFGTSKVEVLGGYTSAILLLGVAGLMAFQSVERLFSPKVIHYQEAIFIAVIGLVVNLVCAWWLHDSHGHEHGHHGQSHGHGHDHASHGHKDLNLRAAYLHVIADAATSVLAIVALIVGMLWGATWMDPVMGIVGAVLVTIWAWGLLRSTSRVLLDAEMDSPVVSEVRKVIDGLPFEVAISDLHVWRIGGDKYACMLSLVTEAALDPEDVRLALSIHEELVHTTVEIYRLTPGQVTI